MLACRISIAAMIFCLLSAVPSFADAPSTIGYQGRLAGASGNPVADGTYDIVVRFWNSETGDTPTNLLWTSPPITVTVTDGLFSILIDIDPMIFLNNINVWMGVAIGTDSEGAPRRRIVSAPYAIDAEHANFADNTYDNWLNMEGDILTGDLLIYNGLMERARITPIGSQIQLFHDDAIIGQTYYSGLWTENLMWSRNGNNAQLNTSWPYSGAAHGAQTIMFDENGALVMDLNAGQTGDASVALLPDAINSLETLNEPGIASNGLGLLASLPIGVPLTMVSLEIETPAEGYISLEGRCGFNVSNSATPVLSQVLITDDPNEDGFFPDLVEFYLASETGVPVYASRIYYRSAGVHTFYLVGRTNSVTPGVAGYYDPVLTATYFPTAYGLTRGSVSSDKSSEFSSREPIQNRRSANGASLAAGYSVDLRELEVKALKARAEADRAENELLKAKIAERQQALKK